MRVVSLLLIASACCVSEVYAQQSQHNVNAFECGFIYDKFQGGKSSAASCSYMGEKVFSTATNPFPASEHCQTENIFNYDDLVNFEIDLMTNRVSWIERIGIATFAVPEMIDYYMRKDHLSREEATKRADTPPHDLPVEYTITNTETVYDTIYQDEITRELLNPPKKVPAYIMLFGDDGSNYSLYISEKAGNAILSEYVSDNNGSWVNLRFGKCRTKNVQ